MPQPLDISAQVDDLTGKQLGKYVLVRRLGAGGMGTVYEAQHGEIERRVAIKVLNQRSRPSPKAIARFRNEARAANLVNHPNIIEVYDFGCDGDGLSYLVMEFCVGETLHERLRKQAGGLSTITALRIAYQIADAVCVAHEKGIVHCDLSSSNIMLLPDPREQQPDIVKILDFGIAKLAAQRAPHASDLTESGAVFGNRLYMAPEQWLGSHEVSASADVFALGMILCECLTGKRPLTGYTNALLRDDAPVLDLPYQPRGIRLLLQRMLAVDPRHRPPMADVAHRLRAVLHPKRAWAWAAASMGLVLAGILTVHLTHPQRPNVAVPRSQPSITASHREVAERTLRDALSQSDSALRRFAVHAVGMTGDPRLSAWLWPLLSDPEPEVAAEVAHTLALLPNEQSRAPLWDIAGRRPLLELQVEAAATLQRLGDARGASVLAQAANLNNGPVKQRAMLRQCEAKLTAACRTLQEGLRNKLGTLNLQWLRTLTAAHDAAAERELARRMDQSGVAERTSAAYVLAGQWEAGDDALRARAHLKREQQGGSLQAAHALSMLGEESDVTLLRRVLQDSGSSIEHAKLAAEALARISTQEVAATLLPLLLAAQTPTPLRVLAAAGVLRWTGLDPEQVAREASRLAMQLQSSSFEPVSLEAVLLTAIDASEKATERLLVSLRQGVPDAQHGALLRLAERPHPHVVQAILVQLPKYGPTLIDVAIRVLFQLLTRSTPKVAAELIGAAQDELRALAASPQPNLRLIAASLAQWGQEPATPPSRALREAFAAGDANARRTLVQLLPPTSPLLPLALRDADSMVRFAAARTLAEAGSALGADVLVAALARDDLMSLVAFGLLRRLGNNAARPSDLGWSKLLIKLPLWGRFEAVDALASLAPGSAKALLRQALSDPAAVVRRQAATVAAGFFQQTNDRDFLDIVSSLRADEDIILRSYVWRRLQTLLPKATRTSDATPRRTAATADLGSAAFAPLRNEDAAGALQDGGAVDAGAPTSLGLGAPKMPDQTELTSKTSPLPRDDGARLLSAARSRIQKKDYTEAMLTLEQVVQCKSGYCAAETIRNARQQIEELKSALGSVRVRSQVSGRCEWEANVEWRGPGLIDITRAGVSGKVEIRRGKEASINLCR